jgi:hypothetical protein
MRNILFILLLILVGCSDAHQAQRGLKKFYKNGGKFNCDTTMIMMSDTIRINGKDSIIYRTFNTVCPDLIIPKTIRETRIEYRYLRNIHKDSLQFALKYEKERNDFVMDSLKSDRKLQNIKGKNTKRYIKANKSKNKFWVGFFIGVIVSLLSWILLKKLFS